MSYFQNDCSAISESALSSPDGVARVATFVLLTIQQMFFLVPSQLADVDSKGADSAYLFGSKREGYRYIQANKTALHRAATQFKAGQIDLDRLIVEYLAIPGLGVVKASFLAQLTVCDGACIDTHNLQRLGFGPETFKLSKTLKPATVLARIATYNAVWRAHGDSGFWWDSWCDYLATRPMYAKRFANGEAISTLHRVAILPRLQAEKAFA